MTKSKPIGITAAEMTVHLSNGGKMNIPVSATMLEAFVNACGIALHDVGNGKMAFYCFDDATIRDNVLPLLPKAR